MGRSVFTSRYGPTLSDRLVELALLRQLFSAAPREDLTAPPMGTGDLMAAFDRLAKSSPPWTWPTAANASSAANAGKLA